MLQYVDQMSTHSHKDCGLAICNNTGEDRTRRWLPWRDCHLRQCPETEHDQNSKTKI